MTTRTRVLLVLGAALMLAGSIYTTPSEDEIYARIEELAPRAMETLEGEMALTTARDYIDREMIPEAIEATVELEEVCNVRNR